MLSKNEQKEGRKEVWDELNFKTKKIGGHFPFPKKGNTNDVFPGFPRLTSGATTVNL